MKQNTSKSDLKDRPLRFKLAFIKQGTHKVARIVISKLGQCSFSQKSSGLTSVKSTNNRNVEAQPASASSRLFGRLASVVVRLYGSVSYALVPGRISVRPLVSNNNKTERPQYGSVSYALVPGRTGVLSAIKRGLEGLQYGSVSYALVPGRTGVLSIILSIFVLGISITQMSPAQPAHAAINEQLNFQARLLSDTGGLVPDGNYHVRFKIYQGGDGDPDTADESLAWTETRTTGNLVRVANGYMSVQLGSVNPTLGSSVDWSNDTIWLSIEIGGNAGAVSWDGEMDPFMRLTSTPYAFNANQLDGRDSTEFVQLDPGATPQAVNTANSAIAINQQGAGNLLTLQDNGSTELLFNQDGELILGSASDNGALVLHDGNGQTATILSGDQTGNRTYTIPITAGDDTFCLLTLNNCAGSAVTLQSAYDNDADGSNAVIALTATDGAVVIRDAASTVGDLFVVEANDGTDYLTVTATGTTINGNLSVTAGNYISLAGGNTASRPGSPTEGMLYFDTDTDSLLIYANGKWQSDRGEYVIVAANDSTQAEKDSADYVADGTSDEDEINSALTEASGGKVLLLAGTYIADSTILVPNNTTLSGVGPGTVIELADLDASENLIEATGANRTGQVIRDLKIDGRNDLNTAGEQYGIMFTSVGAGATRSGGSITNVQASNFRWSGIYLNSSDNNTVTDNTTYNNGQGIYLTDSDNNAVTGNLSFDNGSDGIRLDVSTNNTVSNNITHSNSSGISMDLSSNNNTFTGNTSRGNSSHGISGEGSDYNTFVGNTITSNGVRGFAFWDSHNNVFTANNLHDNGGATANNAIYLSDSDNNHVINNHITDTGCSTTCYAINIFNAASDNNYIANNNLDSNGTINDAGTNTIYGGQVNGSGDYIIQPAGDIELVANTNITGNLTVSGTSAFTGLATFDGDLRISDGSSNYAIIDVSALAGDYTISIPTITGNDEFCLMGLENCQNSSTDEIITVAANDSSVGAKASADYVADGTSDQVEINAALTDAAGDKVLLLAGTYIVDGTILVPNNTTLGGVGAGSIIELDDIDATDNLIEATGTDRTGQTVRDLKLDGRRDLNTAGTQHGIYLDGVGSVSPYRPGSTVTNIQVTGFRNYGIFVSGAQGSVTGNTIHNNTLGVVVAGVGSTTSGNIVYGNDTQGIFIAGTANNITNNTSNNNATGIAAWLANGNSITNNTVANNTATGISIDTANNTTVAGNTIVDSGGASNNDGIYLVSADNTSVSGNSISDTSCSTTCYAINISNSASDNTYLASNYYISPATINDAGTGTVYGGQLTGIDFTIQPAGDIELLANTNITGNLTVSGTSAFTGLATFDGDLRISDGSSNYATITVNSLSGNYSVAIPAITGNDEFCLLTLGNCGEGSKWTEDSGFTYLTQTSHDIVLGGTSLATADIFLGDDGSAVFNEQGNDVDFRIESDTDANAFFIQGSDGYVGIGTNNPGYSLQIGDNDSGVEKILRITGAGTGVAEGGQLTLALSADYDTIFDEYNIDVYEDDFRIHSNGTNRLVIDGATGGATFRNFTNSTNTYQFLNSTGNPILNIDTTNERIGIGTNAPSADLTFGQGSNRLINVETRSGAGVGYDLTVAAGAGNGANTGGTLTLQGGAAGTSGNINGGNVHLTGGVGNGAGVLGLVVIDTPTFATATAQNCAISCTITQANVDSNGAVVVSATNPALDITLPDPTITTAGRIVYVTAAAGSNDFTLVVNGGGTGNEIAMRANTTATMIWNGSDWTAAGASSSTTLQAAYDNTLTSAGGAEIVLSAPGGNADGFTVRNNPDTPITGGILEVQSSIGTNLFSVNNLGTELAANGGAENSTTFGTNWTSVSGAGITRHTTLANVATGQASVQIVTFGTNDGVTNNLSANPATGTAYQVSFTGKLSSGSFSTLQVLYSRNGGGSTQACTNYSTQELETGGWTKITCTITTDGTNPTNPDLIIRQTDGTGRTFWIDNLSFVRNDATTEPSHVQIGGGITGGQVTLFTLDRSSSPPVADGNDIYLGSMYYDTISGRIQCYESDGWGACGSPPNNIITLTPEYAGSVLNGTGVGTMTADFCANEAGILQINTTLCDSGEAVNFYAWTSPQASYQTYSIYLTFQLPETFRAFIDDNTISLDAYTTDTTDAEVEYEIYRSTGSAITECGDATQVTSSPNTWQTVSHSGNEATGCGFAGGDRVIFKLNMTARNNEAVYVSDINFIYTNE